MTTPARASSPPPPLAPRSFRWIVIAAACVAVLGFFAVRWFRARHSIRTVRIATGTRGGTFLPLGQALGQTWQRTVPHLRVQALESPGSPASVAMLERHEAELALVSNNSRGGDSIRLIAPLYEETLQIVVRRDLHCANAIGLRGHRVGRGPSGIGTQTHAMQVLNQIGGTTAQFEPRNLTFLAAADALERNEIDAAFFVAGMRTPVIDRLLHHGDLELLSLGDTSHPGSALDGIRVDAPYLLVSVIPEHAYGDQPTSAIGTISVKALLVARADLDESLVRDLTESMFQDKVRLAERERLLARLSDHFDAADSPFPIHPGADRYYRRDEPSFVQRYNDQIGLAITLGALLWSALSGLRAWRNSTRKGRIEDYYASTRKAAADVRPGASREAVLAAQATLESIRAEAFDELMANRLVADESFTILQDFLTAELARVRRALDSHERSHAA